jgi:hypothetical protein
MQNYYLDTAIGTNHKPSINLKQPLSVGKFVGGVRVCVSIHVPQKGS